MLLQLSVRGSIVTLSSALLGLAVTLPLALGARAETRRSRADVMPLAQVKPGMKGYGLTVFEGTKPERFEVEVIDVLRNFQPRQDLILIKTKHPRLEVARVVAGMSGSPIYLDGKMVGAYAYGWTFPREPVAGVTPIENMLTELDRPMPSEIFGWSLGGLGKGTRADSRHQVPQAVGASGSPPRRFAQSPERYDVLRHAQQLAQSRPSSELVPVTTPLLLGGITVGAGELARRLFSPLGLEPLQAGGGGGVEAGAPLHYEDGGAIGVQLIRGDVSATAVGTVTRVEGERLVAFGHPMSQAGVTALPTAVARVLWFLASENRSFKIATAIRPLGALVQDRQSAIVVSEQLTAPMLPVRLEIEGLEGTPVSTWNFEVAHEKFLTPSLLAVAVGSAIQSAASEKRDVTWSLDSRVKIAGQAEITLEDFGLSIGGTPSPDDVSSWNLLAAVGGVMNNPWQPARIEGVTARLKLHFARDVVRLRGAQLLESEIDAGQPARVRVTLLPFAGPPETRILQIPLPADLAGETVSLEILPGHTDDRDLAPAETLAEFVHNLDVPGRPPRSLIVRYSGIGSTFAFRGRVAPNLPPGVADSLLATTSTILPTTYASAARSVFPTPYFVLGKERVTVKVRPVLR